MTAVRDENRARKPERSAGDESLLTVGEVASRLQVPSSWVYGHADLLGVYRLGKYLRFDWNRVTAVLQRATSPLGSQPNDLQKGQ